MIFIIQLHCIVILNWFKSSQVNKSFYINFTLTIVVCNLKVPAYFSQTKICQPAHFSSHIKDQSHVLYYNQHIHIFLYWPNILKILHYHNFSISKFPHCNFHSLYYCLTKKKNSLSNILSNTKQLTEINNDNKFNKQLISNNKLIQLIYSLFKHFFKNTWKGQ